MTLNRSCAQAAVRMKDEHSSVRVTPRNRLGACTPETREESSCKHLVLVMAMQPTPWQWIRTASCTAEAAVYRPQGRTAGTDCLEESAVLHHANGVGITPSSLAEK